MPRRILIAEADADFRHGIAMILRLEGFDLSLACTGPEALASHRDSPPDLVILDLEMPDMQGLDLLPRLRASPSHGVVPVILLASAPNREQMLQAARLGVYDYFLKSEITVNRLTERIGCLLGCA